MPSCYTLEKLAADRRQVMLGSAHGHHLPGERRRPWTPKLPTWSAEARRSIRRRGRATVVASTTVATS